MTTRVSTSKFVAASSYVEAINRIYETLPAKRMVEIIRAEQMSKSGWRVSYSLEHPCRRCKNNGTCASCSKLRLNRGIELMQLQIHMNEWHGPILVPQFSPPDWWDQLDALKVVHHSLNAECAKAWNLAGEQSGHVKEAS